MSLQSIIETDERLFLDSVSNFICSKDPDVEFFLKNKSLPYEKTSKSRTYLIVDEELLSNREVCILAYFTLALKTLFISPKVSKSKIKRLDGLFNKASNVTAYLIGQIGKNDLYKYAIKGDELIKYAVEIIEQVHGYIGGRFILVECLDHPKLIQFYNNNGFAPLQKEDKYIQLVKFL